MAPTTAPARTGGTPEVDTPEPRVVAPVAAATGALFRGLSALRGSRIAHPRGVGYEATLHIEEPVPDAAGVPLLHEPGEHTALVRFSRSAGFPEPLPDLLGLSVRLVGVHGKDRHQDFMLITSAAGPGHFLLLPGLRGFFAQPYSSVLPYRVGRSLRLVGALPESHVPHSRSVGAVPALVEAAGRPEGVAFRMALAAPARPWRSFGLLQTHARISDEEAEEIRFNPWNTGGGIRPAGPLMGLRKAAYEGSQQGRGALE
ncbi:MAG: hypothetical protein M3133_02350 [Actinomycetota bacterium]|nr:hypothetical protein [Actinomycetota bacterium]